MKTFSLAFLFTLLTLSGPALAQKSDVAGASDHPLVGRYEGAVITSHQTKGYEELSLPASTLERNNPAWKIDLAGKLTSIHYEGPTNRSVLEILRNHEAALKAKGFSIRFFCRRQEQCAPNGGMSDFWSAARGGIGMPITWETTVYLLAEKNDADGLVTVGILGVEVAAGPNAPMMPHLAVTIVEGKPMDTDKITLVEASEIEQTLARDGKIAIYGIYFDFDRADIKPESQPQIEQLGALLRDNPGLGVLIVGHTDGQGGHDYNVTLSQRRAQAVANALMSGFGIAAARVIPVGAGMVAPVASNRTEEGRARNRRVEIVELYAGK